MDIDRLTARARDLAADPLAAATALIAVGTIAAGTFQLVLPGVVLDIVDADRTRTSEHFFAIVGMFMAVVGGLVLHALLADRAIRMVVGWGAVQKLGATLAVSIGVARDVFGPLALAVAAFDGISFVIMALLARRAT